MKFRKILTFLSVMLLTLLSSSVAFAEETAAGGDGEVNVIGWKAMAAALAISISVFAGAFG